MPAAPARPAALAALELRPARLGAALRGARRGAPPAALLSGGVAGLAPADMARARLALGGVVIARRGARRVVLRAWPLASVGAGCVALDPGGAAALGVGGEEFEGGGGGVVVEAVGEDGGGMDDAGRVVLSVQRGGDGGDGGDGGSGRDTGGRERELEKDERVVDRVLGEDACRAYLHGVLLGRCVCVGSSVRITLLGIPLELSVASVHSTLGAAVVRVVEATAIDVVRGPSEEGCISSDGGGEAGRLKPRGGGEVSEEIGGLDAAVGQVLELARVAFDGVRSPPDPALRHVRKRPRGVLLHGPPGTGKTLLARSVATACGAKMEVLSGPSVVGARAGDSEAAVTALFRRAWAARPCVVVLDEVDSIAPRRDGVSVSGAERRLTSALLTALDGGGAEKEFGEAGLFVIGTTNMPDCLDPAMRRAGRFDREIEIGVPDAAARASILMRLSAKAKVSGRFGVDDDELAEIARVLHGFVGADLAALWRETVASALQREAAHGGIHSGGILPKDFKSAMLLVKPSALREVQIEVPTVRWTDIGGMNEVKARLREAIELPLSVVGADLFSSIGVSPPAGLLLYGPPGCSKTLLAKAVATESGANFISIKGPELLSKWVGDSEKAVQATFRRARTSAPCVIFFDEIDALAQSRGSGGSSQSRVVAQLLTEMDGIGSVPPAPSSNRGRVVVIAATNRPDLLDPALVRPGRLGVQLYVGLPNESEREAILGVHMSRVPVADDVDAKSLSQDDSVTDGMSGAELAALVREAALVAMEEDVGGADIVYSRHFDVAARRVRPRTPREVLTFFKAYRKAS